MFLRVERVRSRHALPRVLRLRFKSAIKLAPSLNPTAQRRRRKITNGINKISRHPRTCIFHQIKVSGDTRTRTSLKNTLHFVSTFSRAQSNVGCDSRSKFSIPPCYGIPSECSRLREDMNEIPATEKSLVEGNSSLRVVVVAAPMIHPSRGADESPRVFRRRAPKRPKLIWFAASTDALLAPPLLRRGAVCSTGQKGSGG